MLLAKFGRQHSIYHYLGKTVIMKKAAILVILALIFIFIFIQKPIQAASELETWCLSAGGTWYPANSTCSVNGFLSITEPLNILPEETLYFFYGSLSVEGNIYNDGKIRISSTDLYNYALIENNNSLVIIDFSKFFNYGLVTNYGLFGTVDFSQTTNYGIITNIGHIDVALSYLTNNNIINNYCPGTIGFYGETIFGNPIVYFENCFYFPAILK